MRGWLPLAPRILAAQYILPIGHFGGWLTHFIYVLSSLVPALLLLTGLFMFQHRRWRWAQSPSGRP
ncbi:hypothetical protein [Synechocystis sp. LKSZ1]|uniref:hypothetical protein n=1 Tax=Synechocystis sp. LKSZ1 TaxID=3144951 RepID=UPI00336C2A0F